MSDNEVEFLKYGSRGAYHWQQISPSIRRHNAFVSARYELIISKLGNIRNLPVLDIGGGDGVLSFLLEKQGARAFTVDMSENGLRFARGEFNRRGHVAKAAACSAYKIPFPPGTFGAGVCSEVIEHVQQPELLVSEAERVLKPNGIFVLTTPLRVTEKPYDAAHVREYFLTEIEQLMKDKFVDVEVSAFAPVAWLELFGMHFHWLAGRPLFRYLFNFSTIYLHRNPFKASSQYRYLSMLIASGRKPNADSSKI